MTKIVKILYLSVSCVILLYVALPNFDFPVPPPDSLQSTEPADTESPLRRAYFTNMTRQEVLDWYYFQFNKSEIKNIPMPTLLLNYPPEEAQSIIRDQTRSTFLQEIVNPFRETLFINGFEPKTDDEQNRIVINGINWRQKIIIRYIPSNRFIRLGTIAATLGLIPLLAGLYRKEFLSWYDFLGDLISPNSKKSDKKFNSKNNG